MIAEITVCGITVTIEKIAPDIWTYTAESKNIFTTGIVRANTEAEAFRKALDEAIK